MIRTLATCFAASLVTASATPVLAQNHSYFSATHARGGYDYRHSSTGNFGSFMPSAVSGVGRIRYGQPRNPANFGYVYRSISPSFQY